MANDVKARGDRERRTAVTFWFAVQRLLRRKTEPPWLASPDVYPPSDPHAGDDPLGTGIPRRPPDSPGSAAAAAEPENDPSSPRDIRER